MARQYLDGRRSILGMHAHARVPGAHPPTLSESSGVAAITAPPTTSLWPFKYLVVECITRSAPSASGCCHSGERNVLSAATNAPTAWAASAIARMSTIRNSGLLGVSIHTNFGLAASASLKAAGSD